MPVRVNVLVGGPSAEHEISLLSGREVIANLNKKKYTVRAVVVTMDQEFYYADIKNQLPEINDFANPAKSKFFTGPFKPYAAEEIWKKCDMAFLAMHGSFGEDGIIQGYLDTLQIPYNGSSVFASSVAMNKIATKFIFEQNGIQTPPFCIAGSAYPGVTAKSIEKQFGLPLYVKCPQSGSSRLMARVDCVIGLGKRIEEYSQFTSSILIEKAIKGVEFTCPVLEFPDGTTKALPPVEIRPVNSDFFSFDAKYKDGGSQELVPAPRSKKLLKQIQDIALKAHQVLNCRGVSRTDMILGEDNKLYVLELNSLPGLTPASLLPKSFKAFGGTYPELLDILIQVAMKNPITA